MKSENKNQTDLGENLENQAETTTEKAAFSALPVLEKNAHKGSRGTALIFAGSYQMAGAAYFAALAAIRTGVGMVRLAVDEKIYPFLQTMVPQAVFAPAEKGYFSPFDLTQLLNKSNAVLIGPGLGTANAAKTVVTELLKTCEKPLVLDADALNIIAENPKILCEAKAPVIVTPHTGEMARLTGKTTAEIEANRLITAKEFSKTYRVITVLKGHNTIIADALEHIYINKNGNPGMATAGSGDMLAGIITALLAGGTAPLSAATAGVYFHAAAGDFTAEQIGQRGMHVLDMIENLPKILNKNLQS